MTRLRVEGWRKGSWGRRVGRAMRRSWAFAVLKARGFGGWYDGLNVLGGRRRRQVFGILLVASIVAVSL